MLNGIVSGNFTGAPAGCATYDASTDATTISPSCYSSNSKVYLTNVFDKYPANNGSNYSFSYSAQNNFRDDIVRVDHYFSDKLRFYARYLNDDMPVANPEGLWAGSNYPGLVNTLVNSPGKNAVGNLTWTISPKVVNEFEFAYSQGTYFSSINSGQFATSSAINGQLTNQWSPDPYGKVPAISITGVTGFNAGSAPWNERNLDRTYFDNLSYSLGKHTLRTGFQIQQMIKTENAVNGEPNFSFNSWGDFLVGNVSSFAQTLPDIIPDLHFVNIEAYVQDDWKISPRLTINLGLRWSRLPSVTDVKNTLSNFDPNFYSQQLAPKIDPDHRQLRSRPIRERSPAAAGHLHQRPDLSQGRRVQPGAGHLALRNVLAVRRLCDSQLQRQLRSPSRLCLRHVWQRQDGRARRLRHLL